MIRIGLQSRQLKMWALSLAHTQFVYFLRNPLAIFETRLSNFSVFQSWFFFFFVAVFLLHRWPRWFMQVGRNICWQKWNTQTRDIWLSRLSHLISEQLILFPGGLKKKVNFTDTGWPELSEKNGTGFTLRFHGNWSCSTVQNGLLFYSLKEKILINSVNVDTL